MKTTKHILTLMISAGMLATLSSCSREDDPIPDIPPSEGTSMELNGGEGGADAENTVFVDLSTAKQTAVARDSWNLAFYNGDAFRVRLNNTSGSSAIEVDATDLSAVSESDINPDDLAIQLGDPDGFGNIDDLTGDISKTLIPEVSEEEASNKVYVINPKGGHHGQTISVDDLYKVRITRSGSDYQLEYAALNDTETKTATISKDDTYNYQFFSFTDGAVSVEPAKADWDFRFTWSLHTGQMPTGELYPYSYSDLILINHMNGVEIAEVIFQDEDGSSNDNPDYESFEAGNVSELTFSKEEGAFASTWRKTTGTPLGALYDRYYVIKDAAGNVYKLKFISMGVGEDAGTRGYPELEYKLVQ